MKKFILGLVFGLVLFSTAAFAVPMATDLAMKCIGVRHSFAWIEPTHNADGSLMTNLSHATVYYEINDDPATRKIKTYKARKATGGSKRTGIIITPINCAVPNKISVKIQHVDLAGGVSAWSPVKILNTTWLPRGNSL